MHREKQKEHITPYPKEGKGPYIMSPDRSDESGRLIYRESTSLKGSTISILRGIAKR